MNAELLLKHFDRMSEAPDAVPRLRQFILDLAVRGKLMKQNPTDEPASILLQRIRAEKGKLEMVRRLKNPVTAAPIGNDEEAFEAPPGWCWTRLATISNKIHYGFTASASQLIKDVRMLRITDIQNNMVDWDSVPGCQIAPDDVAQHKLKRGDILIARTGGTIGKTFLVDHVPVTAVFASYLIRVQGSSELYDQYLKRFFESPVYWRQLEDGSRGAGQPNVNGQTLGRMCVPLPPLPEQYRIVAKVEELMALCDQLEAAQTERERRRRQLLESVLHAFVESS